MAKEEKIFYYKDELNDDFSSIVRDTKKIDEDYVFIHKNLIWRFIAFIVYRIIMTPVAFIYCKLKFKMKVHNKKILKEYRKQGYYLFGNHTQIPGDGFIPNVITFPQTNYAVVHPDNVSLKGTEQFIQMVGGIPLPSTIAATRKFMDCLETRLNQKRVITIYPEAHIWPYYTKIRPFKSTAFKYPIKHNRATFCFTVCYKRRKRGKKPKMDVYLDGPFYAPEEVSLKEAQEMLRNEVFEAMQSRSKNSDYEYRKYVKIGDSND